MRREILSAPVLLVVSASPVAGSLLTLETRQTTAAVICTDGVATGFCLGGTQSHVVDARVDGVSHSNNLDGNTTTPSEARTAARSGPAEIAANASIRHGGGGAFENYTQVSGDSLYEWDVLVLNEGDVFFTFTLPPGFVEIRTNAEWRDHLELTAAIQADLQFCAPACSNSASDASLFQMWARMSGTFTDPRFENHVSSTDPTLDASALLHRDVTQSPPGLSFDRTWTWEYDTFTGRLPLGHFVGGQTFTLSYRLRSEAYSEFAGFDTWAAAAINDPFFLSTDTLPSRRLVAFEFVPSGPPGSPAVPEPVSGHLLALGLVASAIRRIPRGRLWLRDGQAAP